MMRGRAMRGRTVATLAVAVATVAWLPVAGGGMAVTAEEEPPMDVEQDCFQDVPAALTPTVAPTVIDSTSVPVIVGEELTINVTVLRDGISSATADELMAIAAESYAPLGIELVASDAGTIDLAADGQNPDLDGNPRDTIESQAAIAAAKAHFGGTRPAGIHLVHVLTDKDLWADLGLGREYAVIGQADCIGGIRYANRAFSVSEVSAALEEFNVLTDPGIVFYHRANAETVAHELGHLFGGHHHYANCVEGIGSEVPTEDGNVEPSPCTLMFNSVDFTSINFSTVNASVVRGHAELATG